MLALSIGFNAHAATWDDPVLTTWAIEARNTGEVVLLGASDPSRLRLAQMVQHPSPFLVHALRPELASSVVWARSVAPGGGVALGGLVPRGRSGDTEEGDVAVRAGGSARAAPGVAELAVAGAAAVGGPDAIAARIVVDDVWVGIRPGALSLGAGMRDRHVGPGRTASLLASDTARPVPQVAVAGEGVVGKLGALRAELVVGVLDGPRSDVVRPGWLLVDARWAPFEFVEVGAARTSIFGGKDRPFPDIGQLVLPTRPHVYDDPDQLLPDQDELAAVDARVFLPIARWADQAAIVDWIELYLQHGAEDVVRSSILGVPVPGLAAVANLGGVEVAKGPVVVTVEAASILDDRFRWYTGHRVYHDGHFREGLPMAAWSGGDASWLFVGARFVGAARGARLGVSHTRRIGAVGPEGDTLVALATDERGTRISAAAWRAPWDDLGGFWEVEVEVQHVVDPDFVPGPARWDGRLAVSRRAW